MALCIQRLAPSYQRSRSRSVSLFPLSIGGGAATARVHQQLQGLAIPRPNSKPAFLVHSTSDSSVSSQKWLPLPASSLTVSDVLWPSAGAFLAMVMLGRLDQMVASKGLTFTIAPLGAVSALLFATPAAPGARRTNMLIAQIACAAFGVLAFSLFGPGWLARGAALAASIAFMIATDTMHPPAASLPLLFIDGAKFHKLHFWYALFPGAVGCVILCLIQEVVIYSKKNFKF